MSFDHLWEGHIKKFFIILIISLQIIPFCFSDQSSDQIAESEQKYVDQIKTSMGPDSKNDNTSQKQNLRQIEYFSYFRIIGTLTVVIIILYLVFYFIKKKTKLTNNFGDQAHILASQAIGPGKWLQTVFISGKYLIIGVTNEHIRLLTEITDPREIEKLELMYNNQKTEDGHTFKDIISDFFKRKNTSIENNQTFDYEDDSVNFIKEQKERLKKMKE
ncbi:MAG: flagellar biosynthetic protein FliO [Spirochaetes bacterium]|nr:flagellar biosynthetic protein FliO [Spirochaetota bacterium]